MHNTVREYRDMHKCSVCGYIYSDNTEDVKFSELPDGWKCPVCYAEKSQFKEA
jgi:rubredoxin